VERKFGGRRGLVGRASLMGEQHTRLRAKGHPVRQGERAIKLGRLFAIVLVAGLLVIGIWTARQIPSSADVVGVISYGASAGATYVVGMLGLIALINFISSVRRSAFLWILPVDFVEIPLDWPVPLLIAGGVALGLMFWK
jgi:hypothetical protein